MSHDDRKHAGGGPEMLRGYAGGRVARLTPTPEEARRAQEAARRAQSIMGQSVSVWGCSAESLHRAAIEDAANAHPRIMPEREATIRAQEALAASMYGQAQGVDQMPRAPGALFSREVICAIVRAEIARGATAVGLYNLLHIFERME